jgi:ribosomal-protein-alanine N-acetyltransferase
MSDPFDTEVPVLESSVLTLRALRTDDAPAVFTYASDPEVARFTLWPAHESEEQTRGFLRMLTGPDILAWAILPRRTSQLEGIVFLHSLNRHHRRAEIAFNVARSRWGRGIASEAARLVLRYSFEHFGLNRVEATCMPGNTASRRVLEKLGMQREGRLRRSHLRHDGFHDMDLYSILRDGDGAAGAGPE